MRNINRIVIHCTASPNGVHASPERVDGWHRENKWFRTEEWRKRYLPNYTSVGYHRLVTVDGRIHPTRHEDEPGIHVAGHNANTFAICMVGTDRFFMEQWTALSNYLCLLAFQWQHRIPAEKPPVDYTPSPALARSLFGLMGITIVGHRDLSPDKNGDGRITREEWTKLCPGFSVQDWLDAEMTPDPSHIISGAGITSNDPVVRRASPQL